MDPFHIAMKYHKGDFCIELTTIALRFKQLKSELNSII